MREISRRTANRRSLSTEQSWSPASASMSRSSSSTWLRITASGLLISCERPTVTSPSVASLSLRSSSRRSLAKPIVPSSRPASSCRMVPEMATGMRSPDFERKVVGKVSTMPAPPWPGSRIATMTRLASPRSG